MSGPPEPGQNTMSTNYGNYGDDDIPEPGQNQFQNNAAYQGYQSNQGYQGFQGNQGSGGVLEPGQTTMTTNYNANYSNYNDSTDGPPEPGQNQFQKGSNSSYQGNYQGSYQSDSGPPEPGQNQMKTQYDNY